jgi:hypothetical protein
MDECSVPQHNFECDAPRTVLLRVPILLSRQTVRLTPAMSTND